LREKLVVAYFSTFAELFECENSCFDQVLGQSVDELGTGFVGELGHYQISVFYDLANDTILFSSAPQVQISLTHLSIKVCRFFERNIFSNQVQVVGADLKNEGTSSESSGQVGFVKGDDAIR
jgi:hypothetical protein